MSLLMGYLEKEFGPRKEDCAIIIEPPIPFRIKGRSLVRKPDALILKDNLFVLIELKAYEGDIIADCSPGATWRSREGRELQPQSSDNPFYQTGVYRTALIEFLSTEFVNRANAPGWAGRNNASMEDWIARHVHSWVVTAEGSQPELTGKDIRGRIIDFRTYPSFKVLAVNKVPNALAFLRAQEPLFAPTELKRFVDALRAMPTTRTEWYRGALAIEGEDRFVGLLPKITDLIESKEYHNIDLALNRIKELDLKPHLVHVIRVWHDKRYVKLRHEALLILIEWQYEHLGLILDEALSDEDPSIVKFALEYLSQYAYPETVNTLTRMLHEGPDQSRVNVIRALVASGEKSVCAHLLNFAEKNLFDKPFRDFQYWHNHAKQVILSRQDRSTYEEFLRLESKQLQLGELCGTVISAFGDLDCKRSCSWLKQIINEPMSLGFESNAYDELETIPSSYYGYFERTCKALGTVGIGDSTVTELLVKRLPVVPKDYQWCIIRALGDLGDQSVVSCLLTFLDNRDSDLYDVTVSALSKLESVEAFGRLAERYLSDPLDSSGRWTGEALANIDEGRFEAVLLRGINSNVSIEFKHAFLESLLPIATVRSIGVLFPLLKEPSLSYRAQWILGNLASETEVFEKAMTLTHSESPVEQASAISILGNYYLKDLNKLSEFEKPTAPVEVRRVLTGLYAASRSIDQILKYAHDPDDEVRSNVFAAFELRDGKYVGHFLVSSGLEEAEDCVVIVDTEGIAIRLAKRIMFLPKTIVSWAIVIEETARRRAGLLLVLKNSDMKDLHLLVPVQRLGYDMSNASSGLIQEIAAILSKHSHEHKLTKEETKRIATLWSNVPEPLRSKDTADETSQVV